MGVSTAVTRIAFLDRDGVINRCGPSLSGTPVPPRCAGELELLPRVKKACALLRAADFKLVVVTNQPDVARGTLERAVVEEINERLARRLALDDVRVCFHDDADVCGCRKPAPGLLLAAAAEFDGDLRASVMVGDRWRDVEAGRRAGCATVLVGAGWGEPFPTQPDHRAADLFDAALWITSTVPTEEGQA